MKNENINTNKSTVNQIQSFDFVANLRQAMDKMSSSCKKNEMVKMAHDYIRTGMSRKETEELLILDGYDVNLAQALMRSSSFKEDFADDTAQHWSFEIEDIHGRIYSSSDFGIVVTAEDEAEARVKAEEKIEELSSNSDLDHVLNIYRV